MTTDATFGDALLRVRSTAGHSGTKLSRKAFGELVGLTPTQVNNIEHGRKPRPQELDALVTMFPELAQLTSNREPVRYGDLIALEPDETDVDEVDVLAWVDPDNRAMTNPRSDVVTEPVLAFSNSEVQTFKRCRRKWWLAWYRKLRLRAVDPVGALAIGTRVHRALAEFYVPDGESQTDPRDALERVIVEDWTKYTRGMADQGLSPSPEVAKRFGDDTALERAMIEGYMEWLAETGADQGLRVVASETYMEARFETPHPRPVKIIGKLDVRVVREYDNAKLLVDHKTAASLTDPVRTLNMDEQMLHYHTLEVLNEGNEGRTDGALYNMLKKVKRSVRAKPPFYDRIEVRHNKHELDSFQRRLAGTITDVLNIRDRLDAGDDPHMIVYPTPTKNCAWDCPFVPVCPMFDDGSRVEDMVDSIYVEGDTLSHYRDKEE